MMTRIFEVSPFYISPGIVILAIPFLLLLSLLLLFPRSKKVKVWEFIKIFSNQLTVVSLILLFLLCFHIYQFNAVYVAYKNGEYNEVSGLIEKYNWANMKEHVWFTVDGIEFYCLDNGWAGHPPYKLARTFYNGMPVRIGYIDISDTQREIVYIDLLDEALLKE